LKRTKDKALAIAQLHGYYSNGSIKKTLLKNKKFIPFILK
jgi:hypothetical protein